MRRIGLLLARLRRTPPGTWPLISFGVADGAALLAVAYLCSAALGIVRQVLFNAQFGVGEAAAAYYTAFRLPDTIGVLVSGGALTNALVPVLLRVAAREGDSAAHRLLDQTLTVMLMVVAPLVALCALGAPLLVRTILAPGLAPATQLLAADLTRLMLLEVLLVISEAALAALLVSRGQLFLPGLAIAVRNVSLIGGILAARLVPGVGIYGPTVGAILDGIIQLAILLPGLRGHGYRFRPRWQPRAPDLRAVLGLLWPNALSSLISYSGGIVDVAYISVVGRAAALGALQNAFLLMGLPIRLLGMAIGQAALPRLAALSVANELPQVRRDLTRILLFATTLASLSALVYMLAGRLMISIGFERGAFDAAAGDLTFAMLRIYVLGLPAYVATEVATRALVARFDTRTPLLTNCLQLALRVGLIATLIGPFGMLVIPAAYVISSVVEALVLLLVLRVRLRS